MRTCRLITIGKSRRRETKYGSSIDEHGVSLVTDRVNRGGGQNAFSFLAWDFLQTGKKCDMLYTQ